MTPPSLSALPDWSAVPSNTEQDRAFLNLRLAYFGKVHALLSAGFFTLNMLIVGGQRGWPVLWWLLGTISAWSHILAVAVAAAQWLLCRKARRSARALNLLDAGGLIMTIGLYACTPLQFPGPGSSPCWWWCWHPRAWW